MKGTRPPSPSTLHQRAYRERMREAGLVKKDVWIRPEYAAELAGIEKRMREAGQGSVPGVSSIPTDETRPSWTPASLADAIAATSAVHSGSIALEWIEGAQPSLRLQMHDYGSLSVFVAVGGEQIVVEAYLWPVDHVADPAAFNADVLATHRLLPLSMVGIEAIGGLPGYILFGSLDVRSSLASVLFEIEALADNVLDASEAWQDYLKPQHRLPEATA